MNGAADNTTVIDRDLAEYGVSDGFWASLDSLDAFKLSAHSSQTVKFSNIRTVSELELILTLKSRNLESCLSSSTTRMLALQFSMMKRQESGELVG